MYEKDAKFTPELAPHAATSGATATRGATANRADTATRADTSIEGDTADRTDPKFVRESNTMRKMHTWQIVALAIAALAVVALVLFYI